MLTTASLSAVGYEHRLSRPVIRLWNDDRHLGRPMATEGGDCENVLGEFAKAGVDVRAVATRPQDERARLFVASWNELMTVIRSKSAGLRQA